MIPNELRPFIGRECRLTVRCHACGREHERRGVLSAGPHAGHVSLAGATYDVRDIVEVSGEADRVTLTPSLARLIPYAGVIGLVAAWLHLAHR